MLATKYFLEEYRRHVLALFAAETLWNLAT